MLTLKMITNSLSSIFAPMNFLKKINLRRRYVIADASDNSITLSRALFRHMDVFKLDQAKVFVFKVGEDYGFMLNPQLEHETPLADIQYNTKYRTVGFECLYPTVNRIFYDYGLPPLAKAKLSVKVCKAKFFDYYLICRPHDAKSAQ